LANEKWSFQELYVGVWMYELISAQFSFLLNELNTGLQGWAKQLMLMFYYIKAYEIELEILNVLSAVTLVIFNKEPYLWMH
jgi:hypothetical protein